MNDGAERRGRRGAVVDLDAEGRVGSHSRASRGRRRAALARALQLARSSTRPCSSIATRSSGTACATTRRSSRARTTTCGRGCSRSRRARTCPSRSSSSACTPAQASLRRGDLQQSFQRRVALREIARLAPGLGRSRSRAGVAARQRPRSATDEGGGARAPRAAGCVRASAWPRTTGARGGRSCARARRGSFARRSRATRCSDRRRQRSPRLPARSCRSA